jgi:iron(III) transport system permease protein
VPASAGMTSEPIVTVEALPAAVERASRSRFDASGAVMALFAAALCLLVVLPIAWLVVFAFTDRARNVTLANFVTLFTDPAFVEPLLITLIIATSVSLICCLVAAPMGWIVARTDVPFARTIRMLVMASFVTPPFLGAIAWELLAAPNSGLLNQLYRAASGAGPDTVLFNIYSLPGLIFVISCYTFPYVFVLVANALDRIPGDLEDASTMLGGSAWRTARRVTIPLALPALAAGALVAFLQAMTLFGSPAILALPAGFHTMTTKIWSLFQYPPKPELAAAAALPLLVLTVALLRAQAFVLGRRGYTVIGGKSGAPRLVRLGWLRWPALALALAMLCLPVFLPYGALVNAAFSRIPSQLMTFDTLTLHNVKFVFFELSATKLAMKNTFLLGALAATCGTLLALVIAYLTARAAVTGHRVLGFLATAPIAIPGIVLGVGLFLAYTRGPIVLYGTLWILLLAYLTIELPAAYQQLQSSFRALAPELEEASRILGASRLETLRTITAPLLGPSLVATWCFIFVAVVRELSAAVILFTSETKVLSVLIFDLKESGDLAAISVLGLTMLILTGAVIIAANRLPGFSGGLRLRNN